LIFLTVGSTIGFDRLVQAVDELVARGVIRDDVLAQIGNGSYAPRHMRFERFMAKPEYERHVAQASWLIGHAGAGTIALALAYDKRLLVVPRQTALRESVNDHQVATARKFEALGHVVAVREVQDLPAGIDAIEHFCPQPRHAQPQRLARRIGDFLGAIKR
jgi:UDP-N-acetylglucosamine transferase subunit ALG13